jgi:arylsulfatase
LAGAALARARWRGGVALAALALVAASTEERPAPPTGSVLVPAAPPTAGRLPEPPDIVLITLDTLRREHLGCYGYFRDTSPNIDALARESVLFERAVAPMASTLPSHISMLTGLYPHQHGISSNWRGQGVAFVSEEGRLSVAAVLRERGFHTAGFASAAPLSMITGVQAGFDTYYAPRTGVSRAADTNAQVLAWLAERGTRPEPAFLWVHYFDAHEPSDPVAPFDTRFVTDERQMEWIRARGIDPVALTESFGRSGRIHRNFLPPVAAGDRREADEVAEITLETVADLMNRYDGELRYLDEQVGVLLDALRRHDLYEHAIIVVVADHGQSLGENGWFGHGTITDVNTLVPLIVRFPRGLIRQPQRIDALVSLTDLMPTVFARFKLAGCERLRAQFEGEDVLSGAFTRERALAERTHGALRDGEVGPLFALYSGRWKLIHRPGGRDELFDLAGADEPVDVAAANPDVLARLLAETHTLLARRPAPTPDAAPYGPGPAEAEPLEALEELGYGGE